MSSRDSTIVVGVAEGRASDAALDWAVREAARRGAGLHLVHALARGADAAAQEPPGRGGEDVSVTLRRAGDLVRAVGAGVAVRSSAVGGPAHEALLRAAADADLVVTGTDRHGARPGRTGQVLAERCPCPLVCVGSAPTGGHGVVAGFDATPASAAALEFAAAEAALRGERLRVVHVAHPPVGHLLEQDPQARRAARRLAAAAVEEVVEGVRRRHGVEAEVVLVTGAFASDVLVGRSRRARLLVVGAHAHPSFLSALFGSTGRGVLRCAHVPVVVVPPTTVDRAPGAGGAPGAGALVGA
ncbi:universal stress protein [Kineococcus gypseus]|uniref:universal stress protein n=1 Tax=Kineococcus gypseus TaxID=1637102 RepID=UPI003D7C53D7